MIFTLREYAIYTNKYPASGSATTAIYGFAFYSYLQPFKKCNVVLNLYKKGFYIKFLGGLKEDIGTTGKPHPAGLTLWV